MQPVAYGSGLVVGPVPIEVLHAALARLRWTAGGTTELTLVHGWLICGLPGATVSGLARTLAYCGGRPVTVVQWSDIAGVDEDGDAILECTLQVTDVAVDGTEAPREPRISQENYGDEWGTREDDLWALVEQEGTDPERLGRAHGPRLPEEPRFGRHVLHVDIRPGWRVPSSGPSACIHAAGRTWEVEADALAAGLSQLRDEDRLHEERAPDLVLWSERAVRRTGLERRPTPAEPEWGTFCAELIRLTRRAARTPPGRLPAWLLTAPGRHPIGKAEGALLGSVRAFPGDAREALRRGGAEVEIRERRVPTPWV